MDAFENATFAQEQEELVLTECWDCGEKKLSIEYIVPCTGSRFYTCQDCKDKIIKK